jgi:hypothetical protein
MPVSDFFSSLGRSLAGLFGPTADQRIAAALPIIEARLGQERRGFDMGRAAFEAGLSAEEAHRVALAIYQRAVSRVWSDYELAQDELNALREILQVLRLHPADAASIERATAQQVFAFLLSWVVTNGQIDDAQIQRLVRVAASTGQSAKALIESTCAENGQKLLADLFSRATAGGQVVDAEYQRLARTAALFGYSDTDLASALRAQVGAIVERALADILADGEVSETEHAAIRGLLDGLRVKEGYRRYVERQIRRVTLKADIRAGRLPSVEAPKVMLDAGELCHWYGVANISGRLAITDSRLLYVSDGESYDVPLRRIAHVETAMDRDAFRHDRQKECLLKVTALGRKPLEFTLATDADIPAAVLLAAAKRTKRTMVVRTKSARGGRIRREVRQRVWQRDGGMCVDCGATQHLEFDHVIPRSKGGSNEDDNVQLLCRLCNAKKSARL